MHPYQTGRQHSRSGQQLHHGCVALGFGQLGGAAALRVAQAAICTQRQQGAHHVHVAARGGQHQRGLASPVRGVQIGPGADQRLHAGHMTLSGRFAQAGVGVLAGRGLGGEG